MNKSGLQKRDDIKMGLCQLYELNQRLLINAPCGQLHALADRKHVESFMEERKARTKGRKGDGSINRSTDQPTTLI